MTTVIEVTRQEAVALIRLNRPKQLNALNSELAREMVDAVRVARSIPCHAISAS